MASSSQRLSREEFKRQKELEELRKAGAAPAEVDEDGRMINPHIPQYISQAPWYLADSDKPGLKHQRLGGKAQQQGTGDIDQWYVRGKAGLKASNYRKGACENCGAITHKARDCVERPRKKGAKYTNRDIAPDEIVTELDLTFDAKRDRWAGFDPSDYQRVVDQHKRAEELRAKKKSEEVKKQLANSDGAPKKRRREDADSDDSDASSEEDEEKFEMKDSGAVIQKRDGRTRTTVRNLRIREDTAKFLYNLDPNSAFYDPKSRSMRENPLPADASGDAVDFTGDNFVRSQGDVQNFSQVQRYAWEASERGLDANLAANPTQTELLHKSHQEKRVGMMEKKRENLFEKYGGEQHLQAPPRELLIAQTEYYAEYSRDGRLLRGAERAVTKSKYIEDEYTNGHTSVWGSFYSGGKWGYDCCHETIRNAYCTGEAGKKASFDESAQMQERFKAALRKKQEARSSAAVPSSSVLVTHDAPSDKEVEKYLRDKHRDFDPMKSYTDPDDPL